MNVADYCEWDQRIPNEPIFRRNFFIQRPPIIPQDFPHGTTPCSRAAGPWLLMTRADEEAMMRYWYYHVVANSAPGVNALHATRGAVPSLQEAMRLYPNRPWLRGTKVNTERESQLSRRTGYRTYNPKDCIPPLLESRLEQHNNIANQRMLQQMKGIQMNTCNIWNQSTSVRLLDPN